MLKHVPSISQSAVLPHSGPAIILDRVDKAYKGRPAVKALTFSVERGSVTALLGGNGAGKSTTIGMILGLILPSSGRRR